MTLRRHKAKVPLSFLSVGWSESAAKKLSKSAFRLLFGSEYYVTCAGHCAFRLDRQHKGLTVPGPGSVDLHFTYKFLIYRVLKLEK